MHSLPGSAKIQIKFFSPFCTGTELSHFSHLRQGSDVPKEVLGEGDVLLSHRLGPNVRLSSLITASDNGKMRVTVFRLFPAWSTTLKETPIMMGVRFMVMNVFQNERIKIGKVQLNQSSIAV